MTPFARRLCVLLLSVLTAGCATARLHREGVKAFEAGAYDCLLYTSPSPRDS